jgi:hypothetical protein
MRTANAGQDPSPPSSWLQERMCKEAGIESPSQKKERLAQEEADRQERAAADRDDKEIVELEKRLADAKLRQAERRKSEENKKAS